MTTPAEQLEGADGGATHLMPYLSAHFNFWALLIGTEHMAAPATFFMAPRMIAVMPARTLRLRALVVVIIHRIGRIRVFFATNALFIQKGADSSHVYNSPS